MNETAAAAGLLAMLVTNPRTGVLIGLLVLAAVIDWRTYRIPNWLTASGILYGLACNIALSRSPVAGAVDAFGGLVLGLLVLLPMYALRMMGAGDVKLMAMVGAFLGVTATLFAVLFTFIAGGVAAIAFAVSRKAVRRMFANVREVAMSTGLAAAGGWRPTGMASGASIGRLPYGVSISAGTLAFLASRQLGFV